VKLSAIALLVSTVSLACGIYLVVEVSRIRDEMSRTHQPRERVAVAEAPTGLANARRRVDEGLADRGVPDDRSAPLRENELDRGERPLSDGIAGRGDSLAPAPCETAVGVAPVLSIVIAR